MPIMGHLNELRGRLIKSLIAMVPGSVVGWVFAPELLNMFLLPFSEAFPKAGLGQASIHIANPMDQVIAYLKLAMVVGFLAGIPVIAWQAWAFVAPGLYAHEKRYALPFSMASTVFFTGGAVFGFKVVFPMAFQMLLGLTGSIGDVEVKPTIMINEYLTFATRMLLAFGVVFEVPVVVTLLTLADVVDYRDLLRFGRWWVLISAVIAGVLTPPDVGSQMLMIVPLVGLYYLSVGISYIIRRRTKAQTEDIPEPGQ